ncbi:hypothetical protein GGS23DRAFT_237313 [Durotheca rogersii]|uniref:uncharacterized protein n=1 Tax=Durotheca rogersii TaxID=419775 RepID=UPI00222109E8|nr:uncharacterized protein GGS23DRAFT_237313 [Durotheca rogersii]KAI5860444.1 hypothetical protein GGS23DRAFT_237313 [Durotheca rogersii]
MYHTQCNPINPVYVSVVASSTKVYVYITWIPNRRRQVGKDLNTANLPYLAAIWGHSLCGLVGRFSTLRRG